MGRSYVHDETGWYCDECGATVIPGRQGIHDEHHDYIDNLAINVRQLRGMLDAQS